MIDFKLTAAVGAALGMYGDEIVVRPGAEILYVERLISCLDVADLRHSWHGMMLPALEFHYGRQLLGRHMVTEYAQGLLGKLQQFMATATTTRVVTVELIAA